MEHDPAANSLSSKGIQREQTKEVETKECSQKLRKLNSSESNGAPSPPNHAMIEPTSFSDENKKRQASDAI